MGNLTDQKNETRFDYIERLKKNVPLELKNLPQWVLFKLEWNEKKQKFTKPPYSPKTKRKLGMKSDESWKDSTVTFDEIISIFMTSPNFDGIGFVFSKDDPYVGIDIDDCITNGHLHEDAKEIFFSFGSYSEYSPSGTGLHIIIKSNKPDSWSKKTKDIRTNITYEMYDRARYFTFTANLIQEGFQEIKQIHETKLTQFYLKYWNTTHTQGGESQQLSNVIPFYNSEENLKFLQIGMEKDSELKSLLDGETRKKDDESSNDFYIMRKLAYWTNKDPELMREVFEQSRYYSLKDQKHLEKWELRRNDQYAISTINNAISSVDTTAFEQNLMFQAQTQQQSTFKFKYLDDKGKPLKIWENIADLIQTNGISISFDEIKRKTLIEGTETQNFDDLVMDIHSLCQQNKLNVTLDFIGASFNRISNKNPYNKVANFLAKAHEGWDGKTRIKQLCDTLIISDEFPLEFKEKLIRKWLVSTVRIAHNKGDWNAEGLLVLQGKQGMGKTAWVGHLIPDQLSDYFAKGVRLLTDNKDSIFEAISNWIVELGELDGTLKSDQAALKAFFTLNTDVQRRPYAKSPSEFPRRASFFGTVNKSNFLKDETGDRRYWILPVIAIDNKAASEIDATQLWGEVMELWTKGLENHYLNDEETQQLYELNGDYRVKNEMQLKVESHFDWDSDQSTWTHKTSAEIADKLGLRSTSGLQEAIVSCGGSYKKVKNKRGYITPPFKSIYNI